MSMKWIGAILVIAGCGGFGFLMAFHYKREIQALKQLSNAVEFMICDLQYRQTPLPQLLRGAAGQCNAALKAALEALAAELEAQIAPDVQSCMAAVLARSAELPKNTARHLETLGGSLGIFDLEGQLTGLRSVKADCDATLQELESNRPQRLRSYQTLGLCAGAALAILFI